MEEVAAQQDEIDVVCLGQLEDFFKRIKRVRAAYRVAFQVPKVGI